MGAGERRRRKPEELRSHRWFGVDDLRSFGHRSRSYQIGFAREDFAGKPVIGIINTWSDINPCHTHFRQRAEEVKRGVRSEEHTSELQSLMRISYAVFCLKKNILTVHTQLTSLY